MKNLLAISRRGFLSRGRDLLGLAAFSIAWSLGSRSQSADKIPRDRYSETLYGVKTRLEELGIKEVTGVGPLNDDICLVLVRAEFSGKIPEDVELKLPDQSAVKIKLNVKKESARARVFTSFTPPPQHSGPLMGGDPVYNNQADWWGTIAFTAPAASPITVQGMPCENRSVSCNHVLYHGSDLSISTTKYLNCMLRDWREAPSATHWVDVASATIVSGTPVTHREIRGLEKIKAVRQPTDGIRVSKYGATTGLTSGKDLGRAWRVIDESISMDQYYVRLVSGLFSEEGDSGAAVLDAERNLVGMIVAGIPNAPDEKYYMHAVPNNEDPPDPDISYIRIRNF